VWGLSEDRAYDFTRAIDHVFSGDEVESTLSEELFTELDVGSL
jgi:hypothetical protein